MWILISLLACGTSEEAPEETETEEDSETEPDDTFTCDVPELRINGEEPPIVGDVWTVFLWCGDTLMTGAMVLAFDPPTIAEVESNNAEFVEAGDAVMSLQVGRYAAEQDVTVGLER